VTPSAIDGFPPPRSDDLTATRQQDATEDFPYSAILDETRPLHHVTPFCNSALTLTTHRRCRLAAAGHLRK
jgi:hypothetical protein